MQPATHIVTENYSTQRVRIGEMPESERIDITKPLWDQNTFIGRVKHFAWVTDPRTCVVSDATLDEAKILVEQYKNCSEPPGTTREQIIYAKKLYESAFHPDSGERQNVFGRMSFQVPGGMAITGAMLQWYSEICSFFAAVLGCPLREHSTHETK
ncbi:Sideroflexin-1 [Gryllus bimaculatus]|nr:Sideroflexin-1 [Gryllus bimaculatus]